MRLIGFGKWEVTTFTHLAGSAMHKQGEIMLQGMHASRQARLGAGVCSNVRGFVPSVCVIICVLHTIVCVKVCFVGKRAVFHYLND